MTVLSEFRILESWCKGEARFYDGGVIPSELDSCIVLIKKTAAPPQSRDLADLRGLIKKYQDSEVGRKSASERISIMQKVAATGTCNNLMFDDFNLDSLGGMVYDLRVGSEAYISSGKNTIRLGQGSDRKDIVTIRPEISQL